MKNMFLVLGVIVALCASSDTRNCSDNPNTIPNNNHPSSNGGEKAKKIMFEVKLGFGRYGAVYRALYGQKVVAIKVAAKSTNEDIIGVVADEISTMHKLIGCPFTSQLIATHWDRHYMYLVMNYEPIGSGEVIQRMVRQRNCSFHQQLAKRALVDLLTAIKYLHSIKLMHVDIKPGNILINRNFRFILADFGLGEDSLETIDFIPTYPLHYPPESLAVPPKYMPASDVWACGATIHHLIYGMIVDQIRLNPTIETKLRERPEYSDFYAFLREYILKENPSERRTASELMAKPEFTDWDVSNENLDDDARIQMEAVKISAPLASDFPELPAPLVALTPEQSSKYNICLTKFLQKKGCDVVPTDITI